MGQNEHAAAALDRSSDKRPQHSPSGPRDADCLRLGLRGWHPRLRGGHGGIVTWTQAGRQIQTLSWLMIPEPGGWALMFESIGQAVGMRQDHTLTRGDRWWWACPRCGRRAGVLWLSPTAQGFACRECHGIRYMSRLRVHRRRQLRRWDGKLTRMERYFGL